MDNIGHPAVVSGIMKNKLIVKMKRQSACSECCAKTICGMGDASERVFTVETPNAYDYQIGDRINLSLTTQTGFRAVWYAYILPLILVLSALFISIYTTDNEIISGIISIIILIPYFFALFLCQKLFKKKFTFEINKE